MATEIVNLRDAHGTLVGRAVLDQDDGRPMFRPMLLAADDGRMFVLANVAQLLATPEYVAVIPVAVNVVPP